MPVVSAWRNRLIDSLKGADGPSLRTIFRDLAEFLRKPALVAGVDIGDGRDPTISGSGVVSKPIVATIYGGTGVPPVTLGVNGDFYFRTDTPGTVNQRIYTKSAGAWVGII